MSKLVAPLVLVLLIALTAAGIVYMLTREKEGETRVFVEVEEIKKIAQLATVQVRLSGHSLRTVIPGKMCLGCRNAYVFAVVTGTITGSVDLKRMGINVNQESKSVEITFPKGSVLVSDPAVAKMEDTLGIETNVFNIISPEEKTKAQNQALQNLRQAAKDMGIEKMTAQEAVAVLTGFLKSLGYEAKINFEDKSLEAAVSPVTDRELRSAQAKVCQELPEMCG
jgi:hypothetical protein